MRQFKFRAWKEYEPDISEGAQRGEMYIQGTPDIETIESFFFHIDPEWPLMQFTGLKDKNGKDIYEGDVVSMIGGASERGYKFAIYWSDAATWRGWGLKGRGHLGKTQYYQTWSGKDAEVIGNIYENPDLLK